MLRKVLPKFNVTILHHEYENKLLFMFAFIHVVTQFDHKRVEKTDLSLVAVLVVEH